MSESQTFYYVSAARVPEGTVFETSDLLHFSKLLKHKYLVTELFLEHYRQSTCPEVPSRLDANFVFTNLNQLNLWASYVKYSTNYLYQVDFDQVCQKHISTLPVYDNSEIQVCGLNMYVKRYWLKDASLSSAQHILTASPVKVLKFINTHYLKT